MDAEYGKCDICGKDSVLSRKEYYYDIDCECCMTAGKRHFEIVRFCSNCKPKPPRRIEVTIRPSWE